MLLPPAAAQYETPVDSELPESFGELKFHRSYRYGKIKITVYRKEGEDE